jgi:hypothetical protein
MSSGEPLTREQVLDELDFLATVEHALIVEFLSVQCALGHDLPADQGGATTKELRDLAADFGRFAVHQMRHLNSVNGVLVRGGQSVQVEQRAESIAGIALGPPSAAQLERLVEREEHIAAAVDQRYERLRLAVESETPVLEGRLLDEVGFIVGVCANHADDVAGMRAALDGLAPADFLRATRRETTDPFEQRLLSVGDQTYAQLVNIVGQWLGPEDPSTVSIPPFQTWAFDAMFTLDEIHRLLVQRSLLPRFAAA